MSRRFDTIFSTVLFVFGLAFVLFSSELSANVIGGSITPATFPRVFGCILMLLSVILLIETLKKPMFENSLDDIDNTNSIQYKRFLIILVNMAVYILAIESLGFIISSFLFLLVSFQVMERKDLMKSVVIAGGFSLVIYFVFIRLLEASIPAWPAFLDY